MALSKSDRESVRLKFGGLCAYCGGVLPARWHVDHLEPVERKLEYVRGKGFVATGEFHRPENDRLDNMMPACPPCNINKHSFSIEQWRAAIANHMAALNAHHSPYRMIKAYGLIKETGLPVTFHFERIATLSIKDS